MGLTELVNKQEGLYTLYLRGSENGQKVDAKRVISACDCCLNPYDKSDFDRIMEIAESDELDIIASNTTEAGIAYDPSCNFDDAPASSFPGKLTQVLYHRFKAGKKTYTVKTNSRGIAKISVKKPKNSKVLCKAIYFGCKVSKNVRL